MKQDRWYRKSENNAIQYKYEVYDSIIPESSKSVSLVDDLTWYRNNFNLKRIS